MIISFLIYLFGLFIFHTHGNSNFNSEYPHIKYCVIPEIQPVLTDPYMYLKKELGLRENCTHITGNLHIVQLSRHANGSDPDLSFLESIVEISGMLYIKYNSVRRIPLGNLRVIRGLTSPDKTHAVEIFRNNLNETEYLEEIDFHNLRVIGRGGIHIGNNRGLQYLTQNVNWSGIINDIRTQPIDVMPMGDDNKNSTFECHPSCKSWSGNSTQHCFGPAEIDCQERTKCSKSKGWCHVTESTEEPCDPECIGGCTGRNPSECKACKNFLKNDQCVSTCSPKKTNKFGRSEIVEDVEDKLIYTTGALCTSKCPYSLLDQDKHCVYQCDFRKYYKNMNRCIECPNQDRNCQHQIGDQQMCHLTDIDPTHKNNGRTHVIKSETLKKLTNCTTIIGNFIVDDRSFNDYNVTIPMLYDNLKKVEEIIGDLTIHLFEVKVTNLTFFRNLREVRGTYTNNRIQYGLKVFVSSLEFLGLKRLEHVYGMVNMNVPSYLCYDDTIPWKEITKDTVSNPKCNKTCDPLCTRGCWGPGNTLCYKCEFLEAGEFCVKSCSDVPGYYNQKTILTNKNATKTQCMKCHPMCKDHCTGPSPSQCTSCLYAKENGRCVKSCSIGYYPVISPTDGGTECRPCHRMCYVGEGLVARNITAACTGPSSILGSGGCSMCKRILIKGNVTSCHKYSCPVGFFASKIKEPLNNSSIEQIACEECASPCGQCSDGGTHRQSCTLCRGVWSRNNCVEKCPDEVKKVTRPVKSGGICPKCHRECAGGCLNEDDNSTCNQCLNKKLFVDVSWEKFVCVQHCPINQNHTEYKAGELVCLSYDRTTQYQQRQRISMVISGSVGSLLVALIAIVLLFRYKFRHSKIKAELKAFYSNFNEPNMKSIKDDDKTRPPNMNRLQMIPISDLIFDSKSKPLGAGAFGKVFRGFWKVPGPDGKSYYLDVVVKVIHNSSKSSTDEFLEEAQIMASVSHRHCLPLIGVCLSLEKPCLVSTFAKYGSLEKYLHQYSSKISSYSLLKWCDQIADGMAYLNMRGIIHRDLAARNILVNDKDIIQITDFGLARLVDNTEDGIVVQSGRVPIRWLALETLLYANYSTASDIWAFGVTLWEIFTFGKRPYEEIDTNKIKAFLQEGNRLYQPDICTLEVYMVMIKCWLEDPLQRPSFTELMTTFEQFSRNAKRYVFIQGEHQNEYTSSCDTNKELICLNQLSTDSDIKVHPNFTNRSDDMSWNAVSHNYSAYPLINQSYAKEDGDNEAVLPRRKKTKRSISFNKFKAFPKIGLTKLLANKSQDCKTCHYAPSTSCDSNRTTYTSCESSAALISHQKSSEYDSHPLNPQVAKLIKQEAIHSGRLPNIPHKQNSLQLHQRVFKDKDIIEERVPALPKAVNRSPSLPPIDIFRFVSIEPLIPNSLGETDGKTAEHSPDSGNNQEFDADDYLVPSRVQSTGYYNLTPSPSTVIKPQVELSEPENIFHNDNYPQNYDDGYLEPTSKSNK